MYFDAHSDIWTDVTVRRLKGETNILRKYHLSRLRKGKLEGSIFVIWVDPPHDNDYAGRTQEIMKAIQAEVAECDDIRIVHNYAEMMKAKADGKFYVIIGIEGMAAVGKDLANIDKYYAFGCRHAMLTWNEKNTLGTGAGSDSDTGLTALGKQAVRKIEDNKMLLDVSHLNERSFWDLVSVATRPIMASHSNAKTICNAKRSLSDEQLKIIRDSNGLVGLNAFNPFISENRKECTVEQLAKHAAHMIDVMGIDHVACGFDFSEFLDQGTMSAFTEVDTSYAPEGLADASEIPNLFACFTKMGMSKEEQEKIAYRNFHRLFREVVG